MKIYITNVFVEDQAQALEFYHNKLGFIVKDDIPMGVDRWLTVVAKDQPDGPQLLLEPSSHPAVKPYKSALKADGLPAASFQVENLDKEYTRLNGLGVEFTQQPTDFGNVRIAVLDDTCGNLVQLVEMKTGRS
ncbi:VOC family protein [Polycladidibacter stylochi]|uniref:VOC family protein n=1 Tax=Polycladidibacter stylochi TaxID=1807766 RepID=UPI0008344A43|nr:VOC family protein [Pseudovibrio stylochi]